MEFATPPDAALASATVPRPRPPGSNPNKDNAKPRIGSRPRTKNVPAGQPRPKDDDTRWIEPLPTVDPVDLEFQPHVVSLPSGSFSLRHDLPATIATPFAEMFSSVAERTIPSADTRNRAEQKIISNGYFKAAKQLYSTMTDPEKGACQPLKAVFYDGAEVPPHMAAALSVIGHVETKLGKLHLSHAPTVFRRWIVEGLNQDPDSTRSEAYAHAEQYVWRDSDGYALMRERVLERIATLHATAFPVKIGGEVFHLSPPPFTPDHPQIYYQGILPNMAYTDEMRALTSVFQVTRAQWVNRNAIVVPNNVDAEVALAYAGLVLAPAECQDHALCADFQHCMTEYLLRDSGFISGLFHMTASPAASHGYGAQFVHTEGASATYSIPLSRSDVAMGFALDAVVPNSVQVQPRIVAYSKRSADETLAGMARRDLKDKNL